VSGIRNVFPEIIKLKTGIMETVKFIEFKVDEKGKESTIFINPRYIITFFSRLNSKDKVAISVVSATGYITVNHSIEEVKKMLGLEQ
jgi:hypothetical protein